MLSKTTIEDQAPGITPPRHRPLLAVCVSCTSAFLFTNPPPAAAYKPSLGLSEINTDNFLPFQCLECEQDAGMRWSRLYPHADEPDEHQQIPGILQSDMLSDWREFKGWREWGARRGVHFEFEYERGQKIIIRSMDFWKKLFRNNTVKTEQLVKTRDWDFVQIVSQEAWRRDKYFRVCS